MNVKLKICGLRDSVNITEVAALQPDYIGFIFYKQSPRFVGDNFELPALSKSVKKVGVFVNENTEEILNKVAKHKLDFVQLHGDEPVEQLEELATKTKVIKVFSVDQNFDFKKINPYKSYADYFLFDTKGKYYGGNARVFDWSILKKYDQRTPFFLSGGISIQSIADLRTLKGMNIHAIDVNSGVETVPAMKNIEKMKQLKQAISLAEI